MAHLYLSHTPGPWSAGDTLSLEGAEAHHALRVARLGQGEHTLVGDGAGVLARAHVSAVHKDRVDLLLDSVQVSTRDSPEVWLAQALAKGGRDELAIQSATELGVAGVIPFAASRSVTQWRGDKVDKGVERWRKIVTEASKQALRAHIPQVLPLHSSAELCQLGKHYQALVLDPQAAEGLAEFQVVGDAPILVVVGPEGGLDEHEVSALVASGATPLRLGDTVLRTSSAGPAALAVLNVRLGRW